MTDLFEIILMALACPLCLPLMRDVPDINVGEMEVHG